MAVDKHINFFELQKASEKPGCPLCRIVSDRADRYIDNMLFEHISDRGFRALHRAAGGFCPYHSRNLVSFRDGLAVAILSRDILEDRIASFEHRKPWKHKAYYRGHSKGEYIKRQHHKHKERCPICVERDRIEEEYLSFLAAAEDIASGKTRNSPGENSSEVRELRSAIEASDGLCIPHYARLLITPEREPRKVPQWIREFHEKKYRDLLRRINDFIEFSAYGRQEEFAALSEKDQLVWKEAATVLRGSTE